MNELYENICAKCPLRQTSAYIAETGDMSRAEFPRLRSVAVAKYLCEGKYLLRMCWDGTVKGALAIAEATNLENEAGAE